MSWIFLQFNINPLSPFNINRNFILFSSLDLDFIVIVCPLIRLLIVLVTMKFEYATVAVFFSLIFPLCFSRNNWFRRIFLRWKSCIYFLNFSCPVFIHNSISLFYSAGFFCTIFVPFSINFDLAITTVLTGRYVILRKLKKKKNKKLQKSRVHFTPNKTLP